MIRCEKFRFSPPKSNNADSREACSVRTASVSTARQSSHHRDLEQLVQTGHPVDTSLSDFVLCGTTPLRLRHRPPRGKLLEWVVGEHVWSRRIEGWRCCLSGHPSMGWRASLGRRECSSWAEERHGLPTHPFRGTVTYGLARSPHVAQAFHSAHVACMCVFACLCVCMCVVVCGGGVYAW